MVCCVLSMHHAWYAVCLHCWCVEAGWVHMCILQQSCNGYTAARDGGYLRRCVRGCVVYALCMCACTCSCTLYSAGKAAAAVATAVPLMCLASPSRTTCCCAPVPSILCKPHACFGTKHQAQVSLSQTSALLLLLLVSCALATPITPHRPAQQAAPMPPQLWRTTNKTCCAHSLSRLRIHPCSCITPNIK